MAQAAAGRGSDTVRTPAVTAVIGPMATVALAVGGVRAARRRARTADRGSGTVWTLAVTAVIGLMATVALAVGGVRVARHRALTAADLAALAAASHAPAGPGAACRAATEVATGSGASLSGCVVRGGIADVTVVVTVHVPEPVGVLRLRARARAGPADPTPYAVPPA